MKTNPILAALLALALIISGCASNPHRVVYNTSDSIASAVNLAEKAWANYTVATAKNELVAEGAAPTVANITAKVDENPNLVTYLTLDADYRAAYTAYLQAYQAYQIAGESGVLDPAFREKAVAAANALIDAISTISSKPLTKAK